MVNQSFVGRYSPPFLTGFERRGLPETPPHAKKDLQLRMEAFPIE
jgi:hypothetical protein